MEHDNDLFFALNKITEVPSEEWDYFKQFLHWELVEKGYVLLHNGEICDKIYFCGSGILRMYYHTNDGDEYNKSFIEKKAFFTSYSSLILSIPSYFTIESMTASVIASFPGQMLDRLYKRHSCWETIGRKLVEQLYIKKELKERQLLVYSAEDRYRNFLQQYPDLSKQIPQYHIASYLGITQVSLSRLKRKNGLINNKAHEK